MPSAFDHPLVSQRYLFPRSSSFDDPFWVDVEGGKLACRRRVFNPAWRTLVHFHGNGETVADYVGWDPAWQQMQLNVCYVDYPGYGMSEGVPRMAAMLADTSAVAEALALAPEQLVVFGRSVGSIYAIEFVRRYPDVAGLILESGVAEPLQRVLLRVRPEDLGTTLDALRAEARELFDHEHKLGKYRRPLLVLHARGDDLVTPDNAQRNHDWAASVAKRIVLFERGDHNSIFALNRKQYLSELREFLGGLA